MRKSLSAIAVLAAGSLALTGCGSKSNGSGSGSSSTGSTGKLSDLNIQPRSALKTGGTLRFAISQLPADWNIYDVIGNQVDSQTIWNFTGVQNFDFAEDATYKPDTEYLTSFDVQKADGSKPQVVTLHLNPKAKWNSGRQIDYSDYLATWKANNGSNAAFKNVSSAGWDSIKSVEKGSSNTDVVITFNKPYPDWAATLSSVQPKEGVSDPNTFNSGWSTFHPEWHTGPFTFDKLDKAQKMITLKRNPNWWGDPALLDSVSFRELETPADVNAFANSEVDVVAPMINATAVNTAKKRQDAAIRASDSLQWRQFTVNSKAGNLTDQKVRQAMQIGMNRQAMAGSDLAGLPLDPSKQMLGNHFFMPGQAGYQDNSGDWSYNVDKAKKLLDDDGWTLANGAKVRTKNGKQLTINYTMLNGVPTSENEGKLFQSDMAAIGIQVNVTHITPDDYNKVLSNHSFEVIAFTYQGTDFPMNGVRQIYGADKAGSTTPGGGNYSQLVDPEIEKLIPQIDSGQDNAKRVQDTNAMDKLIWQDVYVVPLYQRMGYAAVPKNLANYGSATFQSTRMEDVGYTK